MISRHPRPVRRAARGAAALALLAAGAAMWAADWPRFRGAALDGVSTDPIVQRWPAAGLRAVWRSANSDGYSSLAVSGNRLFTLVNALTGGVSKEFCVAMDAANGRRVWSVPLGPAAAYSTPTVQEGRVYVYSGKLKLLCLGAADGTVLWAHDLMAEFGGQTLDYDNSQSPWVEGGRVFVSVMAATNCLMAFDASDGSLRWRGHAFGLTHGSPVGATFGGVRQVVFPDRYGLASVAQDDGRLLWRYRQGDSPGRHGPSPLISGDIVVCMKTDSSRWGAVRIGCTNGLFVTTTLWTNAAWADTYATAVVHGGCLYGLSRRGLDCRELPTGRPKWFTDQAANGSVVRAGERLVVLTQRGELVLIQPSESGYQEVSRCTVTTGAESLNSPALSGGRVYLRNPGEIVCVDAAPPAPLRLQAQLLPGTGRLSLQALGGDGQPIPAARAARIGVLTSPDLRVDPAQWTPLPLAPILTNGALVFEEPFAPASPARYYRAVETEE